MIEWHDLTVPDAEQARDFYTSVLGLHAEPVDMGGYSDFNLVDPKTKTPVAGVCHARGSNTDLPPQWMAYFTVADLDASLQALQQGGGAVLGEPKTMGSSRYAFVRDPFGAVCALFERG